MIDTIRFRNYRIFGPQQELHLRPITIVFGKNNSGKSAILKLPILIENILENKGNEIVSDSFEDGPLLFSELKDIVYGKSLKVIDLGISNSREKVSMDCSFFVDMTKKPNSRIEKCALNNGNEQHSIMWDSENLYHIDNDDSPVALEFAGIVPNTSNLKKFYDDTINRLKYFTDYIGAIRVFPKIDMRLQNSQATKSGIDGSLSYQMLIADALGDNLFVDKVSDWYKKNFSGWSIEVDKRRQPVIHIEMQKNGLQTNITETGMGITQSLPIVIRACAPCKKPTLIAIEEPETHLHPAAHASLSELIAMSIKGDENKRYLIETHSKNFILRLRRLIANKQLDVNDVALYYVSFDGQFSALRQINISEDGSVDFWPSQMFDESLQETIAIRTIQLEQAKRQTI